MRAAKLREHFSKVLYLRRREPDTAVRGEGAQLCRRLAAMNQRWPADWNLDWTKRIQFAAGGDLFAHADVFHLRDPRFIWRCPGWIKNNYACFAQASRQRKLWIADADLVGLNSPAAVKDIHSISGSVADYSRIRRD